MMRDHKYHFYQVMVDDRLVTMQIWDTAGQVRTVYCLMSTDFCLLSTV